MNTTCLVVLVDGEIESWNNFLDVKRMMGSRFSDTKLQKDIQTWPFKVIEGFSDKPMIVLEHKGVDKEFTPEHWRRIKGAGRGARPPELFE
ncbi:putative Heat shock protein 70 family [Helianthus anomalus]